VPFYEKNLQGVLKKTKKNLQRKTRGTLKSKNGCSLSIRATCMVNIKTAPDIIDDLAVNGFWYVSYIKNNQGTETGKMLDKLINFLPSAWIIITTNKDFF